MDKQDGEDMLQENWHDFAKRYWNLKLDWWGAVIS